MAKFSPSKDFNTRKHLAADAPYVRLLCEKLHAKIAAEWPEKWQPLGLGNSLTHCREIRCYSAFIKALNRDIFATCNLQINKETGIESSLKRLLDSDKLPKFLQKFIRDMLMTYLGYKSWEVFKHLYSNEVDSSYTPSEVPPSLPVQPTQKVPLITVSYTRFVHTYTFSEVN